MDSEQHPARSLKAEKPKMNGRNANAAMDILMARRAREQAGDGRGQH